MRRKNRFGLVPDTNDLTDSEQFVFMAIRNCFHVSRNDLNAVMTDTKSGEGKGFREAETGGRVIRTRRCGVMLPRKG